MTYRKKVKQMIEETLAERIVREAWADFEAWLAVHNKDGELSVLDAVSAYSKWCDENGRFR